MIKVVYGQVGSDKLPSSRVTCLRPDEDGEEDLCIGCEKTLRYKRPPSYETLISVCCSSECSHAAGYYPERRFRVEPSEKTFEKTEKIKEPDKPVKDPCPVCGGDPYKRGWRHVEGCANSASAKLKKKAKAPTRDNCAVCDGPPWKRGWRHVEGCANSSAAKIKAKQAAAKKKRRKK